MKKWIITLLSSALVVCCYSSLFAQSDTIASKGSENLLKEGLSASMKLPGSIMFSLPKPTGFVESSAQQTVKSEGAEL
ncbi:MAG: hypothetical protein P4L16_02935 [Chlamydiales bacterium]|nr:hypothetical protein [Chlamydiales bacterium]